MLRMYMIIVKKQNLHSMLRIIMEIQFSETIICGERLILLPNPVSVAQNVVRTKFQFIGQKK